MISLNEATAAALEFLHRSYPDETWTYVMKPEVSQEYPVAWAVRFDTQEHIDTGDLARAPFTRVVIVPKDGSAPYFRPSAWSMKELAAQLSTPRPPEGS